VDFAFFTKPLNDVINVCSSICHKDRSNVSRIEVSCIGNFLDSFLGGPPKLRHINLFNNVHHFLQRELSYLRSRLEGFFHELGAFFYIVLFGNLYFSGTQVSLVGFVGHVHLLFNESYKMASGLGSGV